MKNIKPLSQFQIALKGFKQSRLACVCLSVLVVFYLAALFADFLSPYSYDNEDRNFSYGLPTPVRCWDEKGLSWPYVNAHELTFNENHQRVYKVDEMKKYKLQLFVKGDSYRFLGIVSSGIHLFGVEAPGRIYLWGADARGRDMFSRILYGARISLTIGLIGVVVFFFFCFLFFCVAR